MQPWLDQLSLTEWPNEQLLGIFQHLKYQQKLEKPLENVST